MICILCVDSSGATDHKTHGSDHITFFESRIGSLFGSTKEGDKRLALIARDILNKVLFPDNNLI